MAAGSNVGPGRKWKPGQSGNPKGRPKKGESFTDILTAMAGIKDVRLGDGTKIARKQALCEMLWTKAIRDHDSYAAKFIIERLEGKTPLPLQGPNDEDGNPTPIPIVQTVERMSLEDWRKTYNGNTSGSHSPDKPKPSPAQPKSSSSAARKAAGKATSSSGTSSRTTKSGAKRGKGSSSGAATRNSTTS